MNGFLLLDAITTADRIGSELHLPAEDIALLKVMAQDVVSGVKPKRHDARSAKMTFGFKSWRVWYRNELRRRRSNKQKKRETMH